MPHKKYDRTEGTITNGTTQTEIFPDGLSTAFQMELINDSLTADLTVQYIDGFGNTGHSFTVKAGEIENEDKVEIRGVLLTNNSGSSIAYRAKFWGKK